MHIITYLFTLWKDINNLIAVGQDSPFQPAEKDVKIWESWRKIIKNKHKKDLFLPWYVKKMLKKQFVNSITKVNT